MAGRALASRFSFRSKGKAPASQSHPRQSAEQTPASTGKSGEKLADTPLGSRAANFAMEDDGRPIEVRPAEFAGDPDLSGATALEVLQGGPEDPSTVPLSPSDYEYEFENGRRYHSYRSGSYPIPNDDTEKARLRLQHWIYSLILGGKLYRAPINKDTIRRVLDIGTGSGEWVIEFADDCPNAEQVLGVDLSPIQSVCVPQSVEFVLDDCELEWVDKGPFDFIHIRSMVGGISDWQRLINQAYTHLKPGGWIEVTDFESWASSDDNTLPSASSYISRYQAHLNQVAIQFGKPMHIAPRFERYVQLAGFTAVTDKIYKIPIGTWPANPGFRDIGGKILVNMCEMLEPYSLALFTRVLGWSEDEVEALVTGAEADLRNPSYHMYTRMHSVCGMKPIVRGTSQVNGVALNGEHMYQKVKNGESSTMGDEELQICGKETLKLPYSLRRAR